jgi:hypothetical protein
MFDEKTIKTIPSSDNAVRRVVHDTASDIFDQVGENQVQAVGFRSGSQFRRRNGAFIVLPQSERKGDRRRNVSSDTSSLRSSVLCSSGVCLFIVMVRLS